MEGCLCQQFLSSHCLTLEFSAYKMLSINLYLILYALIFLHFFFLPYGGCSAFIYEIFKKQSKDKKRIDDIRDELKDPTYNISKSVIFLQDI